MKECKCGNYKPYIETMKPGVGYAPMMPFTACVNCYGANQSNKPTIDDLQKENDELRANHLKTYEMNIKLCSLVASMHLRIDDEKASEMVLSESVKIVSEFRADQLTPAQSLAEVKAEAVIEAADKIFSYGCDSDAKSALEHYANKLRGDE